MSFTRQATGREMRGRSDPVGMGDPWMTREILGRRTVPVAPAILLVLTVGLTALVQRDGPLFGEVGLSLWINRNTPPPIDRVGDVLDPLVTDLSAPLVFLAVVALVRWRWGWHATTILGAAGVLTSLTRAGDLVQRPRPTASGTWTSYTFGSGGYPSGHVVFTVLVTGTVALLARRHSTPTVALRLRVLAVVLVAVACWTRISRLEHWPLDVAGGLLVASLALYAVAWLERSVDPLTAPYPRIRLLLGLPTRP